MKRFPVFTANSSPICSTLGRSFCARARFFGILGVATLGYYVGAAISEIRLDVALFLMHCVAALSMGVDALSRRLRRRLRIEMLPTRLSNEAIAK